MNRRISRLLFTAAVAGFLLPCPLLQAESLQEAVKTTIESNPDIRSVAHNRLARDQQIRQARSGYFPTLEVSGGVGVDDVNEPFDDTLNPQEIRISLRQNVFAGLSTMNEVERQEARVRSEAYLLQATSENTALNTARAYLDVLRQEALLELARENLLIHQQIGDQIRLRSESGVDRKADMDQIKSRIRLAESNVEVATQNLIDARTTYEAVVGHPPENLTRPADPGELLPVSLEEARQQALDNHPQLKSASADLDARKAQDEVAKSPFMPIVDLELDQIWEDETNYSYNRREDLRGMVRLRYNLFNGWKDQARKAETVELINEAREIRNHTHRQVLESIRLSWQAYRSLTARLAYLKERIHYAANTAKAYHQQWNIGKRTLLDVLDSEAERIDAAKQYINADYDSLYAKYRVLNSTGRLVRALDLKWPEEAMVDGENSDHDSNTPDNG